LLQEKIITESKISSLIFLFFQLDVLYYKWFNVVSILTANGLRLKKVGDFEAQTFFWKPYFKCKINFH
jgi:hypothetical protein